MFNDGVRYGGQSPGAEARIQEAPDMFGRLPKSERYLSHYLTENAVLTPVHSLYFFYSLLFCQKENNKKKYSSHKMKISSVQFSCSVVSDSLQPHGLQHARPPCLSPTPGVHSNSCPLSRWCHLTISSSHPLLLLPSIFPSIRVFSKESLLHIRWPKYWFQLQHQSFQWTPRTDLL